MKRKLLTLFAVAIMTVTAILGITLIGSAEENADGLKNTSLNLAENVTIYMEVAISDAPDGAYALIELPDEAGTVKQLVSEAAMNGENYIFTAEIAIKNLADDVSFTVYDAENNELVPTTTTSAIAYCENYLDTLPDGEFAFLVEALMAYADAAKLYFGEEEFEGEADVADLSDVDDVVISGTIPAGLTHRSASLLLETETVIRHYFALDAGKYIQNYEFFVDLDLDGKCDLGEELTPKAKGTNGLYYVDIEGITPNELDIAYKLCVNGKADGNSYSCTYGALTYLKRISASTDSQKTLNLVFNLYNYYTEASYLTGTVSFYRGSSLQKTMTYKYGVTTPITLDQSKADNIFLGWFDENGNKVTEIPASATGDITLTCGFKALYSYSTSADCENVATCNLINCSNHVATSAENDVCANCGYCVSNADCPFIANKKNHYNDVTCATCENVYKKVGSVGNGISFGDNTNGYAKSVALADGSSPIIMATTSGGSQINIGSKLKNTLYNNNELVHSTITFEFSLGIPTEDQVNGIKPEGTYVNPMPDVTKPMNMVFRFGKNSSTYSNEFYVNNGVLCFDKNGSQPIATLPKGSVATYKAVFDFSGAVCGDGVNDSYILSFYDQAGNLLGSKTGTMKLDIGDTDRFIQMRSNGGGVIMYDDIKVSVNDGYDITYVNAGNLPEDAPKLHNIGAETALPVPTMDGAIFAGWYTDAALTQPIESIPANAAESFRLYAKWNKMIGTKDTWKVGSGTSTDNGDGTITWTTTGSWQTVNLGANVPASNNSVFTLDFNIARVAGENAPKSTLRFSTEDRTYLILFNIIDNKIKGTDIEIGETITNFKVVLDFERGVVLICNSDGLAVSATEFSGYNGSTDPRSWKENMRSGDLGIRWDSDEAGSYVVESITVTEG